MNNMRPFNSIEKRIFYSISAIILIFSLSILGLLQYAYLKIAETEESVFKQHTQVALEDVYLSALTEDRAQIQHEIRSLINKHFQLVSVEAKIDQEIYRASKDQKADFYFEGTYKGIYFKISGVNQLRTELALIQFFIVLIGLLTLILLGGVKGLLKKFIREPVSTLASTFDYYTSEDFRHKPQNLVLKKTGTELDVLMDKANKIYVSQLRAISEETALREALEKAVETKSIFIASMVHDFRTPLVIMQGLLDELSQSAPAHLVSPLKAQVTEMDLMVTNALDLTRIESGKSVELREKTIDLFSLVQSVIDSFQAEANHKGLYIYADFKRTSNPVLSVDEAKYKQVLRNLVSNAVKYTQTGKITITIDFDQQFLYTRVSDTGRGISPEQEAQLFIPFKRMLNDVIEGTGVGLSFCKLMLQNVGCDLIFERPETGTVFYFNFPMHILVDDAQGTMNIGKRSAMLVGEASPEKKYIARYLQCMGYTVVEDQAQLMAGSPIILHELLSLEANASILNSHFPLKGEGLHALVQWAKANECSLISMNNVSKAKVEVLKVFGIAQSMSLVDLKLLAYLVAPQGRPTPLLKEPSGTLRNPSIYQKSILVADDVLVYQRLVVQKLKNMGFQQILTANNGQEAVNLCKSNQVDVVFMDHMMPILSGELAAQQIKETCPETLVIGFSAVAEEDLMRVLASSPMDKIFVKDFAQFDQVIAFIEGWYQ